MTPERPEPFSAYTTPEFWDDDHISAQMLAYHLDPVSYPASRPHAFIDASAAWLVGGVLAVQPGDRLLDLGCGPGLYSNRLARRGVDVTGVDVSRRSFAHAHETALTEKLSADFRRANYLTDGLGGPYDAAILVYEDYCALSPEQRVGLLRRTHDALRPGGRFAMDVTAAPRFAQLTPGVTQGPDLDDGFWALPPYEGTHETFTYPSSVSSSTAARSSRRASPGSTGTGWPASPRTRSPTSWQQPTSGRHVCTGMWPERRTTRPPRCSP